MSDKIEKWVIKKRPMHDSIWQSNFYGVLFFGGVLLVLV
jgi:hypothetical protein